MFQKDEDEDDDDSGDENNPYASIDKLRKKILSKKGDGVAQGKANTLAPPDITGGSGGRPLSISEQIFSLSLPSASKPASSLTVPDLYERVEEVPSPFLDYDMVSKMLSFGVYPYITYANWSGDLSCYLACDIEACHIMMWDLSWDLSCDLTYCLMAYHVT